MPTKKKKAAPSKAGTKRASTATKRGTSARAAAKKPAAAKKSASRKKAAPAKKTPAASKKATAKKTTEPKPATSRKTAAAAAAAKPPAVRKASAPMTASRSKRPASAKPKLPPIPTAVKRKRSKALNALVELGRKHLGIVDLREGQAEALQSILDGKDTLAVMPTGSGKSLLYQLPSLQLPGLTVVVSPLIALIKDQVDKMHALDVPCARIDSTLTTRQRRAMDELILAEGGKLVLTTPERMADPEFREFLNKGAGGVGVSLFVVDEAHCVSHWGHDFRPSYLVLKRAIKDLGRPQLLATTATAPPHVREDIAIQLEMPEPAVVTTTFDRPNLHYEVIALPGDDEKTKTLVTLLKKLPRPGLVYCATVRKVKQLYEQLSRHGIPVGMYHGRMTKKERDQQQEAFMPQRTDLVMLATNAFGLGVDKPDIRYVLHYHVPGSLEAYAQEAGRGGRDGKPTRCVLLFSPDDVAIQEFFLKGTYPTRRQVRSVVRALEAWDDQEARAQLLGGEVDADAAKPTLDNVALASQVGKQRTRTVLNLLQSESWVNESEDHLFSLSDPPPDPGALMEKAKQYEARRIADRQRLDALLAYVAAPACRSQVILDYLGEPDTPPCGRCDNDLRSKEAALEAARAAAGLERVVTADLDAEEGDTAEKPRRVIRHRIIDLDAKAAQEAQQKVRAAAAAAAAAEAPVAEAEAPEPDELERLIAEQAEDEDEYEYEYVDGDEEFIDEEGYEYGEVEEIGKTAAEIAEEDDDPEDSEITILKRKQREKPPKPKKKAVSVDEPKRKKRRRRRRRKKKVSLPSAASFSSPVLDGEEAALQRAARHDRPVPSPGGPLVEYVRGSMRINSTPVASATPNDQPGKGKRRRRRKPGGAPGGPGRRPQGQLRPPLPAPAAPSSGSPAPPSNGASNGASAQSGEAPPRKKKRRRRRRRKGAGAPGGNVAADGPISFFSIAVSSPTGNRGNGSHPNGPRKKKRRRRRRGGGGGNSPSKTPS